MNKQLDNIGTDGGIKPTKPLAIVKHKQLDLEITKIINGIGSPYGDGAEYEPTDNNDINSLQSNLDDIGKENLRKDLNKLITSEKQLSVTETKQQLEKVCQQCGKGYDPIICPVCESKKAVTETIEKVKEMAKELNDNMPDDSLPTMCSSCYRNFRQQLSQLNIKQEKNESKRFSKIVIKES